LAPHIEECRPTNGAVYQPDRRTLFSLDPHESRKVILVLRFARAAGALLLAILVSSCSPPDAPEDPQPVATRAVAPSPTTTTPSDSAPTSEDVADATEVADDEAGAVPAALVGTWQSVDQGSAEDLIEIHADGSYLRAMVLMQQRPSGIFSYTIATEGNVEVDGSTLRVVPTEGTESLTDPDSPSDSYTDQPTDLEPEEYQWSVSGSSLFLDGEFGVVELRPST
jgi:hypothetical protein